MPERDRKAARIEQLEAINADLLCELENLFAMVQGEAPSLLENHHSYDSINAVISKAKAEDA